MTLVEVGSRSIPPDGLEGVTEPRLWTPSLRRLTPKTSGGFAVIEFAAELGVDLMPWQRWALVHGLELLPGGRPRFRTVLMVVARQNGKTTILQVLALHHMVKGLARLVLGTSTNMEYAREAWNAAVELAEETWGEDALRVRRGAMDTSLTLANHARYKIASASRTGGRSLSVDLGIADELREHFTWDAWAAMSGATIARPASQIWALSNAGDDRSLVLNHLRDAALAKIDTGEGDESLGLFEWSASDGCDLDDRQAWAQANPALGLTITEASLQSKLATTTPAVFRTEHLSQRVATLDAAVDGQAWKELTDSGSLDGLRDRVAVCLDVAPDLRHVSLVAAAVADDGRVRVEVVEAWEHTADARAELPGLLEQVRPRVFGWFPGGPGAALAAELREVKNVEEIKSGEAAAVCQGFAEQVQARRVLHTADALLTAQIDGVSKLYSGDGWRFTRRGVGHCDAVYAAAGAVHLARMLPPGLGPFVIR